MFSSILVNTSCYMVHLELLSIAMTIPAPFACASVASIFSMWISICWLILNYILAIIILAVSTLVSKTTASSSG